MSDKHKEISAKLKALLQGLDDDRLTKTGKLDVTKTLNVTTTRSFSVAKEPSLRVKNQAVLRKRVMTREEREAEAKRLAIESRPQFPDARCIFVQHTRCLGCGHESEGVSHPLVFLRLRRLIGTSFSPTDISYVPEREYVEYPGSRLPRLVIHHTSQVQRCHKCFTNAVHWFPGQDTALSTPNPLQAIEPSFSAESSSLTTSNSCKSATDIEEKSGTPTSPSSENPTLSLEQEQQFLVPSPSSGLGSTSSEEPSLIPAHARHTSSLIEETAESVREEEMNADASLASELAEPRDNWNDGVDFPFAANH